MAEFYNQQRVEILRDFYQGFTPSGILLKQRSRQTVIIMSVSKDKIVYRFTLDEVVCEATKEDFTKSLVTTL